MTTAEIVVPRSRACARTRPASAAGSLTVNTTLSPGTSARPDALAWSAYRRACRAETPNRPDSTRAASAAGIARLQQVHSRVDPLSLLPSTHPTIPSHAITVLPDMSLIAHGTPRPFQSPVAQRDIKAEVIYCVGGVISPLIFSIALHGMEEATGAAYRWNPYREAESAVPGTPVLVRYADDLVALCDSREQAEQVKARLGPWLAARALAFNEEKTRVVHLEEGFDFLGFNVRRYGQKLLIKPSAGAVRRIRKRLADEVRALRGANATAVIRTIAPIVRGWSAYYRGVVSTETFQKLDGYLWQLLYKWALYRHNHRSRHQIVKRYFGQFHPYRKDRWVFGSRETGAYLPRFGWTKIVRHDLVKGRASPDDPALARYWAARRRKEPPPPVSADRLRLLRKQQGRCPLCGNLLLHADREPQSPGEWEQWAAAIGKAIVRHAIAVPGSPADRTEKRLVHEHCRRRHARQQQNGTAGQPASPSGLA